MPQIREQIAMVHLPPSKTLKYLFHVRKTKSPVNKRFSGLFFFARLLKIGSKLWKEQAVFWKEQGDFERFCVFEPLKSVLFAII